MNTAQDNPRNPGPLSEEQLVDWIDGTLPPDQAELLSAASGRTDLKDRIAQMQRQKRVLASLSEEQAPPELLDRVLAALERDALIGIATGDGDATLPEDQSSLMLGGRTRSHSFWQRTSPRLAMAAGLTLLVVGVSYFGALALSGKQKTGTLPAGPLAKNTPTESRTQEADSITQPDELQVAAAEKGAAAPGIADKSEAASTLAATSADEAREAAPRDLSDERTLELAREGRLVVRVLAKDTRALPEIERRASAPGSERQWRLDRQVPADVVAAVLPGGMTRQQLPGPTQDGEPLTIASATHSKASLVGPLIGPGAAARWTAPAPDDAVSRVRGTYLVDLPRTERGFNVIKTVFQNELKARVIFEEAPAPLDVPQRTTPESVLWWTQPSGQWVDRVTVPLIVEQG